MLDSAETDLPHGKLSVRELAVLELTARGNSNARMAAELGVTVHAVKFHLASIYRKLGVRNRTEAALVYLAQSQPTNGDGAS